MRNSTNSLNNAISGWDVVVVVVVEDDDDDNVVLLLLLLVVLVVVDASGREMCGIVVLVHRCCVRWTTPYWMDVPRSIFLLPLS